MCRALQPHVETAAITPGTTIDRGGARIVVDTRVGAGGMGVVWRGWLFHAPGSPLAKEPPVPVALKVLRPQAQMKAELRAFFAREADTLRRLSHPNIVRFYDIFEHAGASVLALEYVDGSTLEEVVARHTARARLAGAGALPGMPFRRSWYYFQQLLGALAAIHAIGIVHRDVKPSNVLIRQDGILKLTDFGIARLAPPPGVPQTQPTGEMAPGTSAYMSPEQVLSRPIDGRSDLYSAAIVLYEMLSGRTPFGTDKSEFLIRQDQVETRPPPIRTWLTQAPPTLDALFARALAKDPEYRFASAIEMGEAFRVALGLRDTPEWRAQGDIAAEANAPTTPDSVGAHDKRMATLREFVVRGYRTAKMASM